MTFPHPAEIGLCIIVGMIIGVIVGGHKGPKVAGIVALLMLAFIVITA